MFLEGSSSRQNVFNHPVELEMTNQDRRTESYCKRVLGVIRINDHTVGSLDYHTHIGILYSLANHMIHHAEHDAHKLLTVVLP
jgi:hypothetical protein